MRYIVIAVITRTKFAVRKKRRDETDKRVARYRSRRLYYSQNISF